MTVQLEHAGPHMQVLAWMIFVAMDGLAWRLGADVLAQAELMHDLACFSDGAGLRRGACFMRGIYET